MLTIDSDELAKGRRVIEGMAIECPHCGEDHILKGGTDEDGKHSAKLLAYNCGRRTYLAAINGHIIWRFFESKE